MLDLGLIYVHYMTGLGLLLTFWELLLSSSLGILDPFIGVPRLQEIAEELLNTCIVQPCLQFAGSKMLSEFRPSKRETLRGLGFESGIPSSRSRETAAATERVTHVDANFTSKLKAGKAKWEEAPADP